MSNVETRFITALFRSNLFDSLDQLVAEFYLRDAINRVSTGDHLCIAVKILVYINWIFNKPPNMLICTTIVLQCTLSFSQITYFAAGSTPIQQFEVPKLGIPAAFI